jgi:hypothetical protein
MQNVEFFPTLDGIAAREGISLVAGFAGAHGLMIVHSAQRVETARSSTRVGALVTYARQVGGTVTVDDALWTTIWRSTDGTRDA